MMPVTGPYTRTANPIRGVPGGGLPWIITAGNGALKSDGRLLEHVRGLVLADQAPVPPTLQGTPGAARSAARPPSASHARQSRPDRRLGSSVPRCLQRGPGRPRGVGL